MKLPLDPLDSNPTKLDAVSLNKAKAVGGQYGLISSGFGVLLAYLIGIFLFGGGASSILWFLHLDILTYAPVLAGVVTLFLVGYFWGRLLAVMIADNDGKGSLFGAIAGLLTLLLATLVGTITLILEGAILEGTSIFREIANSFNFLPGFLILITGALPAILTGVWLGRKVAKVVQKQNAH